MELSFSKKAKLETLDNFKYPKTYCCKQSFLCGFFYDDVKQDDFTYISVQPDIIKSTKIVKKLLFDIDIDSYVVTKETSANKHISAIHITEEEQKKKMFCVLKKCIKQNFCAISVLFILCRDFL